MDPSRFKDILLDISDEPSPNETKRILSELFDQSLTEEEREAMIEILELEYDIPKMIEDLKTVCHNYEKQPY